jgi:hypothetical protein
MKGKVRVNITVDKDLLERAKTRLGLFGGKLSTLFNAYLKDFVDTMDKKFDSSHKDLVSRIADLERKVKSLEGSKGK